jgi:hypothetical protein
MEKVNSQPLLCSVTRLLNEEVMNMSFVNTLTIAADLGVYVGALGVVVTVGFGIAELVGLADRFLAERAIRRAFIRSRKTPMAKVVSLRQRRAVFGQRELERRK